MILGRYIEQYLLDFKWMLLCVQYCFDDWVLHWVESLSHNCCLAAVAQPDHLSIRSRDVNELLLC